MSRTHSLDKGFTLIELLVVIAIIGALSSIVVASLAAARDRANDAKRLTDIRAVQTALELYASTYNSYPSTGNLWSSKCSSWPDRGNGNVIPGLVPTYIPLVPSDPAMDATNNSCCYVYRSNGTNYKFLVQGCPTSNYEMAQSLVDPKRDGGLNDCIVDGGTPWAWSVYSSGGTNPASTGAGTSSLTCPGGAATNW